eukprot:scaffold18392_cov129-Isochrysis_galbana.AAC.5
MQQALPLPAPSVSMADGASPKLAAPSAEQRASLLRARQIAGNSKTCPLGGAVCPSPPNPPPTHTSQSTTHTPLSSP